jgi:hypothetical protein
VSPKGDGVPRGVEVVGGGAGVTGGVGARPVRAGAGATMRGSDGGGGVNRKAVGEEVVTGAAVLVAGVAGNVRVGGAGCPAARKILPFTHSLATVPGTVATPVIVRRPIIAAAIFLSTSRMRRSREGCVGRDLLLVTTVTWALVWRIRARES